MLESALQPIHGVNYQDPTNLIQSTIQNLLTDGVVSSGVVIRSILLSADQQLRMEQLPVISCADLVDRAGIKINEDGSRDIFSTSSLSEHGVELAGVVKSLRVGIGATILLETVLEEIAEPR